MRTNNDRFYNWSQDDLHQKIADEYDLEKFEKDYLKFLYKVRDDLIRKMTRSYSVVSNCQQYQIFSLIRNEERSRVIKKAHLISTKFVYNKINCVLTHIFYVDHYSDVVLYEAQRNFEPAPRFSLTIAIDKFYIQDLEEAKEIINYENIHNTPKKFKHFFFLKNNFTNLDISIRETLNFIEKTNKNKDIFYYICTKADQENMQEIFNNLKILNLFLNITDIRQYRVKRPTNDFDEKKEMFKAYLRKKYHLFETQVMSEAFKGGFSFSQL